MRRRDALIRRQKLHILPNPPILFNEGGAVSTSKQAHPARAALARAIEDKVGRMDLAVLLELATILKAPVPAAATAVRGRERTSVSRTPVRESKVLHGGGIGPVVSVAEGSRRLDAITVDDESVDWVESNLVGAGALAARLNISRGTLDNWRRARKVIALRKGLRNFVYPLRQFERRGPVEGLDLVAPFFASDEEAWEWLVAPNRMTHGRAPIEALRDGDVRAVADAAAGAFDYA
jgi:hypothetical protein